MVEFWVPSPAAAEQPAVGTSEFQAIPLQAWTWSKPSIIAQLAPKPDPVPPSDPVEPQFHVQPIARDTGFRSGQLIQINFPISKSSFF